MSIPNIGPEHPETGDPGAAEGSRRGNPPPLLRDEPVTDDVAAASTRASVVSHRFGVVRYALTRPESAAADHVPLAEEGDSHARE